MRDIPVVSLRKWSGRCSLAIWWLPYGSPCPSVDVRRVAVVAPQPPRCPPLLRKVHRKPKCRRSNTNAHTNALVPLDLGVGLERLVVGAVEQAEFGLVLCGVSSSKRLL